MDDQKTGYEEAFEKVEESTATPFEDKTTAPVEDPYERSLKRLQSEGRVRLTTAARKASKLNPQEQARALRLHTITDLPLEAIRSNLPEAERVARETEYDADQMMKKAPSLAKWMSDENNAAIAEGDLETLGGIEWAKKSGLAAWQGGWGQVEYGFRTTALAYPKFFEGLGLDDIQNELKVEGLEQGILAMDYGAEGILENIWVEGIKQIPQLIGAFGSSGVGAGIGMMASGSPSPEDAGTIPVGAVIGPLLWTYVQEFGPAHRELSLVRSQEGDYLHPELVSLGAGFVGSANAVLEMIGFGFAARLAGIAVPGFKKALRAVTVNKLKDALVRKSFTQAGKRWLLDYGQLQVTEGITEAMQEVTLVFAEEAAKAVTDGTFDPTDWEASWGRIVESGVKGWQASVMTGGIMSGPRLAMDVRDSRKAAGGVARLDLLVNMTKDSKLLERAPEKFRELVSTMKDAAGGAEIENVYIPVRAFNEVFRATGADPADVATAILGESESHREALETNGDLIIPIARYLEKVAKTDAHENLKPNIRLYQSGFSLAEMEERNTESRESFAGELARDTDDTSPGEQQIHNTIYNSILQATGDEKRATANARLMRAAFATMGTRLGRDPLELFQTYLINYHGPDTKVQRLQTSTGRSIHGLSPSRGELTDDDRRIRDISTRLATGDPQAIQEAAKEMVEGLDPESVLVPVPDALGATGSNLALASAISGLSGAKVLDMLTSEARTAQGDLREGGGSGLTSKQIKTALKKVGSKPTEGGEGGRPIALAPENPMTDPQGLAYYIARIGGLNHDESSRWWENYVNDQGNTIPGLRNKNGWNLDDLAENLIEIYPGFFQEDRDVLFEWLRDEWAPGLVQQTADTVAGHDDAMNIQYLDDKVEEILQDAAAFGVNVKPEEALKSILDFGDYEQIGIEDVKPGEVYLIEGEYGTQNVHRVQVKDGELVLADGVDLPINDFTFYQAKKLGKEQRVAKPLTLMSQLPKGAKPVLIDAVRASGATIESARQVVPGASYLTYGQELEILDQRGFHGGPFRFKKFSTRQIDTGEQAQAFGWGLYFTDKPEIAEIYRRALSSGRTERTFRGETRVHYGQQDSVESTAFYELLSAAENLLDNAGYLLNAEELGDLKKEVALRLYRDAEYHRDKVALREKLVADAKLREQFKQDRGMSWSQEEIEKEIEHHRHMAQAYEMAEKIADEMKLEDWGEKVPGQVYEVEIPDNESLMVWDVPMMHQPEAVLKAIRDNSALWSRTAWANNDKAHNFDAKKHAETMASHLRKRDGVLAKVIRRQDGAWAVIHTDWSSLWGTRGRDYYANLAKRFGMRYEAEINISEGSYVPAEEDRFAFNELIKDLQNMAEIVLRDQGTTVMGEFHSGEVDAVTTMAGWVSERQLEDYSYEYQDEWSRYSDPPLVTDERVIILLAKMRLLKVLFPEQRLRPQGIELDVKVTSHRDQDATEYLKKHGIEDGLNADRLASMALKAAGIPGHRYWDGTTRHKTDRQKSYNYVIYDDRAVEIKKTFYQDDYTDPYGAEFFEGTAVVDEQGVPKVVYHGTDTAPEDFKRIGGLAGHFGTVETANERLENRVEDEGIGATEWEDQNAPVSIMPVYLSIKNPVRMSDVHFDEAGTFAGDLLDRGVISEQEVEGASRKARVIWATDESDTFVAFGTKGRRDEEMALGLIVELLEAKGYDGIVYENRIEGKGDDSWIPFSPEQIKSATANTGAYSLGSKSIVEEPKYPYSLPQDQSDTILTSEEVADNADLAIKESEEGLPTSQQSFAFSGGLLTEGGDVGPVRGPSGSKIHALQLPKDFKASGYVEFRGQKIENAEGLAYMARVLRDPRIETMRFFWTKDGEIVAQEAMTSFHPSMVSFAKVSGKSAFRMVSEAYRRAKRVGANGYWMVHNHPSGNAEVSAEDKAMSGWYRAAVFAEWLLENRSNEKLSAEHQRSVADILNWVDDAHPRVHGDPSAALSANDATAVTMISDLLESSRFPPNTPGRSLAAWKAINRLMLTGDAAVEGQSVPDAPGLIKFQGHTVLDHRQYGLIDENLESKNNILISTPLGRDLTKSPHGVPSPYLGTGQTINTPKKVAVLGRAIYATGTDINNGALVVYCDPNMKVVAIEEVPNGLYTNPEAFADHVVGRRKAWGSNTIFTYFTNPDLEEASLEHYKRATVTDNIHDRLEHDPNDYESAIESGHLPRMDFREGRPLAPVRTVKLYQDETPDLGLDAEFYEWFGKSAVVDEQGTPKVYGHGTATAFRYFDIDMATDKEGRERRLGWGRDKFYFGTKEAVGVQAEYAVDQGKGTQPNVIPVYLRVENPIGHEEYEHLVLTEEKRLQGEKDGLPDTDTRDEAIRIVDAELKGQGVDGIYAGPSPEHAYGWAVFDASQIRSSIDPSLELSPEKRQRLIALHNLSAENLEFSDEMGGLAMPSIAVMKERSHLSGFGEITLIGTKNLVNPEHTPVFSADAYSPRMPKANYKAVRIAKAQKLVDEIRPWVEKYEQGRFTLDETWDAQVNSPNPEALAARWQNSNGIRAMFLDTKGIKIKTKMIASDRNLRFAFVKTKAYREYMKKNRSAFFELHPETNTEAWAEYSTMIRKAIDEHVAKNIEVVFDKTRQTLRSGYMEGIFGRNGQVIYSMAHSIEESGRLVGKKELNEAGISANISNKLEKGKGELKAEFWEWAQAKVKAQFGDPRIKVGGKFEPYTLDNIVRKMRAGKLQGTEQGMTFGAGKARAVASTRFTDMTRMRNQAEWDIKSKADVSEAHEKTEELLDAWRSEVIKYYEWGDTWDALDASMRAIAQIVKKLNITTKGLNRALHQNDFKGTIPMDVLEAGVEAAKAFNDAPVEYFEAKPTRGVALYEFSGAVVPHGTDEKVLKILERHGIQVEEYDSSINEAFDDGKMPRATATEDLIERLSASGEQTLFQPAKNNGKRGYIEFTPGDKRFDLHILKGDVSTVLHETAHFYLELLADMAEEQGAGGKIQADYTTILKWLGVKSRDQIGTEQHEKWARGFERYLMEGKAPSAALREVFTEFKVWLSNLYRRLTTLDVELSDEVRGVFDRMLASDEEIREAQKKHGLHAMDALKENMTGPEWEEYQANHERVTREAQDELRAEMLGTERREQEDWYKKAKEKVQAEVEREFSGVPLYRALLYLQKGQIYDLDELPGTMKDDEGSPLKISRQDLIKGWGKDVLPTLPRPYVYRKTGGITANDMALLLGMGSGDELVSTLQEAPSYARAVAEETKSRMNTRFSDLMENREELAKAATTALHSDASVETLFTELRVLGRALEGKGDGKRRTLLDTKTLRERAKKRIEGKTVGEIKPYVYQRNEGKAANAALKHAAAGRLDKAYDEKQIQLWNHALYREAVTAKKEIDKFLKYARRLRDSANIRKKLSRAGHDYLGQIDGILEKYELKSVPMKRIAKRKAIRDWMAERQADNQDVILTDRLLDETRRINYQEITLEELYEMKNALKNIDKLASLKTTLLTEKGRRDFEAARHDLISTAEKNRPQIFKVDEEPNRKKTARDGMEWLKKYEGLTLKIEELIAELDGEDINGPWHEYVWDISSRAQTEKADMLAEYTTKLRELSDKLSKEQLSSLKKKPDVWIEKLQKNVSRHYLLAVALNTGNKSNWQRLVEGRHRNVIAWDKSVIDEMLDNLTEEEFDLVQGIWKTLESLWPRMAAKEKRTTGVAPPRIDPRAFTRTFTRPDGTTYEKEYPGGYFPVVFDRWQSVPGRKTGEGAEVMPLFDHNYTRALPPHSHLIPRIEGRVTYPLKLDIDIINRHLSQAIHDLAYDEFGRSVYKLLTDPEIRSTLIERVGPSYYDQLLPWLRDQINEANPADATFERLAAGFRHRFTVGVMGLKFSIGTQNIANLSNVLDPTHGVRGDYLVGAMKDFILHPIDMRKWVDESSGVLRHRFNNIERDLKRKAALIVGKRSFKARAALFWWSWLYFTDSLIAYPAWAAANRQGMENKGMDQDTARRHADSVITRTLSSGAVKDLPALQRGGELAKTTTMFYTWFSGVWNRIRSIARDAGRSAKEGRLHKDFPVILARTMAVVIVPAIVSELASGRPPEEDEDWVTWAAKTVFMYPVSSMPIIRDIMGGIVEDYDVRFGAMGDVLEEYIRTVDETDDVVFEDDDYQQFIKHLWRGIGYSVGLPVGQPEITFGYLHDVYTGEEDPDDVVEFMRDATFRRRRKKK